MKHFLLIGALALSVSAAAQVTVTTKKRIDVTSRDRISITAIVRGGDTSYILTIQDYRYKALEEFEAEHLTKDQVIKFADAILELAKDKYAPGESSVKVGTIEVAKEKFMGGVYTRIYFPNGAYCWYTTQGRARKSANEIREHFNL